MWTSPAVEQKRSRKANLTWQTLPKPNDQTLPQIPKSQKAGSKKSRLKCPCSDQLEWATPSTSWQPTEITRWLRLLGGKVRITCSVYLTYGTRLSSQQTTCILVLLKQSRPCHISASCSNYLCEFLLHICEVLGRLWMLVNAKFCVCRCQQIWDLHWFIAVDRDACNYQLDSTVLQTDSRLS